MAMCIFCGEPAHPGATCQAARRSRTAAPPAKPAKGAVPTKTRKPVTQATKARADSPVTSAMVTVRISTDDLAALDSETKRTKSTRSAVIRALIGGLDRRGGW